MDAQVHKKIHPEIVKETENALQSFFKKREYLPEVFRNLSKKQIKEAIQLILETDFCKSLMARYYVLGDNYIRWADLVANLTGRLSIPKNMISNAIPIIEAKMDLIYLFATIYVYSFAFHNYPVYRVDENLIDFLDHTELPKSFDFYESIPLTLFILPKNKFFDDEGIPVNYLLVQRGALVDMLKPHPSEEYMAIYKYLHMPKKFYKEPDGVENSIGIVFSNKCIYWSRRILHDGKLVKDLKDKSENFSDSWNTELRLLRLAVHLISIIHHEPNLIIMENNQSSKEKGFSKKVLKLSYPQKITIPWDESYRYKSTSTPIEREKSTHATKSTHWRRGHWRRLPGEERRLTWVRPTLVNPPQNTNIV